MRNLHFRLMTLALRLRDLFVPPRKQILDAGIKPGDLVLDYGCGPGAYSLAAAELVGEGGKVYAADMHPLALRMVQRKARKKGFRNVRTLQTDGVINLDDETVDVVLLYDVFHDLANPDLVLKQLHRVLKPPGILSFSDHHMREGDILQEITVSGLFRLMGRGKRVYRFSRA